MSFTKLQKKGVLETLFLLHKQGSASRTELKNNVNVVLETIYNTTLPTLKDLRLIDETRETTFPFAVKITLTEKGVKVAEKLAEIQKILNGT